MANVLDVSNNQGHIDWHAVVASGVQGVWCKATEGKSYVDQYWIGSAQNHRAETFTVGIKRGAYHFARPGDPIEQARFFYSRNIIADLPPALDLENPPSGSVQWASGQAAASFAVDFLTELERLTGVHPILYTFSSFALSLDPRLKRWPLWLAHWGYNNGQPGEKPTPKAPWTSYIAWQYTSKGQCPGVNGFVDRNIVDDSLFTSQPPQEENMPSALVLAPELAKYYNGLTPVFHVMGLQRKWVQTEEDCQWLVALGAQDLRSAPADVQAKLIRNTSDVDATSGGGGNTHFTLNLSGTADPI